jgi:prolyl 4-hydroxylase
MASAEATSVGRENGRPHSPILDDGARNAVVTSDREISVIVRLKRPELALLGNVFSEAECAELIELARPKLEPSSLLDGVTGYKVIDARRTSTGTFFRRGENELVDRLDKRISELTGWPVERGEDLQIANYQIGADFIAHHDYFSTGVGDAVVHLANGGQRVATLIVYLNEVDDGGETIFPKVGLTVTPKAGNAVYFTNCDAECQVDPLTLHEGAKVRKGEKWIATKWFRYRVRV